MEGLNLGNLCKLMKNLKPNQCWLPPSTASSSRWVRGKGSNSQAAVLTLIYTMIYPDDQVGPEYVVAEPTHANAVFQHKSDTMLRYRQAARGCDMELICYNFSRHYFGELDSARRTVFVQGLQELVRCSDLSQDPQNLQSFLDFTYEDTEQLNDLACRFAAAAIYVCLISTNQESKADQDGVYPDLPDDVSHYDPYNRNYHKENSTALRFSFIDSATGQETGFCHSHERAVERVLDQNLLITRIECEHGLIRLYYDGALGEGLTLRRLEREDIPAAVTFVRTYLKEFRPKYSWGTRTLAQMAENGLDTEKWTAHAYFDRKGRMVSYLDYKMRSDGEVELGIQLTDEDWRKRKLATGLVNLHRFQFMNNRLFVSTFEENAAMRRVLEQNGFRPNHFYDPQTRVCTNKIRERINPSDPGNKMLWTNSVYYFADSLLSTIK